MDRGPAGGGEHRAPLRGRQLGDDRSVLPRVVPEGVIRMRDRLDHDPLPGEPEVVYAGLIARMRAGSSYEDAWARGAVGLVASCAASLMSGPTASNGDLRRSRELLIEETLGWM